MIKFRRARNNTLIFNAKTRFFTFSNPLNNILDDNVPLSFYTRRPYHQSVFIYKNDFRNEVMNSYYNYFKGSKYNTHINALVNIIHRNELEPLSSNLIATYDNESKVSLRDYLAYKNRKRK